MPKTPLKRGRQPEPNVPPVEEEQKEEQTAQRPIAGSLADGIDDWRPMRRDVKLNSSDSDTDEEELLPPSAQKKKSPTALSPTLPQASEENAAAPKTPAVLKRTREVMEQEDPAVVDAPGAQYVTPEEDVYDSDKEDEYVNRANVELFGLQLFRGNWEEHFKKEDEAHLSNLKTTDLNLAIQTMDSSTAEGIMEGLESHVIFNKLTAAPFSLHEAIRTHTKDRSRDLERTVRTVLHYLPILFLRSPNREHNTILNCAIISDHERLVKYLIDIGSPLDIKNVDGMGAVQLATIYSNPKIFRMVLMRGGTFHYLLREYGVCYPFRPHRAYFESKPPSERDPLLQVVSEVNREIDSLCLRHRSQFQPDEWVTQEFGPIVTLPRGKLADHGYKYTVTFRFPEISVANDHRFMLALIPIQFCPVEKRLAVKIPGVRMSALPEINRVPCHSFATNKTKHPTYFDCTRGVLDQLRHPKNWAVRSLEFPGNYPAAIKDFRTTFVLDTHVDPREPFDFLACQVFRVELWAPIPSLFLNYRPPSTSPRPSQQRGSPRSPGPIRRGGTPNRNQQWNQNQHQANGSHQQPGPSQRHPFPRNNNFNGRF